MKILRPRLCLPLALAALAAGCDFSPALESATSVQAGTVPAQVAAGDPLPLTFTVVNAKGETVTRWEGTMTLALSGGAAGATLGGTTSAKAVKGVATFPDLAITAAAASYRITVTPEILPNLVLSPVATSPITVVPGPAKKLAVVAQPGNGPPGGALSPPPAVAVADTYGNAVTNAVQVTASLAANPTGGQLSGGLTASTSGATAVFDNLAVDKLGTGYTLSFAAPGLDPAISAPFNVSMPRLVYTDPPSGAVRLVRNPASTDATAVLDLVATSGFTGGYSVGFNLPYDTRTVQPNAALLAPGSPSAGLDPGSSPAAVMAAMPSSGPLAGILTAGISQKAAGAGAVTSDRNVAAGTVLFTVRLDLKAVPLFTTVFDGAALGPKFGAAVRNKKNADVVPGADFGIGKLEVK